ncbi:hypothetical protein TRFO_02354 [Tritrichomonas foetus]|uniref:Mediator of RNA polymerase II transcription subunit 4 n=1 Tax=Tritrichomonas foetus TaxID=1144522 RepID=A0A1J4J300_9EUKA|nr:hypothetical protein TRFO_02354 [Tritrichomonas foetus]|eukprot:OHS93832.1 hypothetical protein TRFO_02354 [Tritrichomonas foetus]
MAKQMPLHAELSNCLSAYKETFERILYCIVNACDSSHKKHDSPITIQVQDLLSIDAELQRHLERMETWNSRQEQIEKLEQQLKSLSNRVNDFAQALSSSQTSLQGCLSIANKLQKGVMQRKQVSSIEDLMNSTKIISPEAETNQANFSYPWMPESSHSGEQSHENIAEPA